MEATRKTDPIDRAIEAKASGIRSLAGSWRNAIELLRSAGAGDVDCLALLDAFSRPSALATLARCWGLGPERAPGGWVASLAARADESAFPIRDWLAGLEKVAERLEADRRTAPLATIVGYVECSAELAARQPGASLPDAVSEMVQLYGFEG